MPRDGEFQPRAVHAIWANDGMVFRKPYSANEMIEERFRRGQAFDTVAFHPRVQLFHQPASCRER